MLTLETKNREVVDLMNGLLNVQNLEGKKFSLVVSKNIKLIQNGLAHIEEAAQPSEEFIELSKQANALNNDQEAIGKLEEKNAELVKSRKDQLAEIDKMLEGDIKIELHVIGEDILPDLEQGIYFSKSLYFSVGGIGSFGSSPFSEISKRFYSRIDPQNPLPALIIRTKNLNIF